MEFLHQLITDYTLRTVALGAATLGLVSGAMGTYAVLRRQSLVGDAVAHAALPGIALAFLFTGSKLPLVLMLGAAAAGWVATLLIMAVVETTRIKYDSALGLTLSVFFGFGLVLLTYIQRHAGAGQAGLDTFLFGQAAALIQQDVLTMAALGGLALLAMTLLWKEFKLLSFDPAFGQTLGFPMRFLDVGLTTLLVVAIVIGLQTVGVVLMSSMLVAPAAAARQWTDHLGVMVFLSMSFGALSGVSGAILSSTTANLPTGPTIVLCVSTLVVFSLLLAPRRGLVWRRLRQLQGSRRLHRRAVLLDLYALAQQHATHDHAHAESVLNVMQKTPVVTRRALRALEDDGLVRQVGDGNWALTEKGLQTARRITGQQANS